MKRWFDVLFPPLFVFVVLTVSAELYMRWVHVRPFMMAKPTDVFRVFTNAEDRANILGSLWTTACAALIGFGVSAVVGVLLSLALSTSRLVQRAFYPYTIFFQTVPIIAIAPMLVFWVGAGVKSVATCAFIASVFPVIANTLTGLLSTEPALRDLFKLYGASRVATMWKLKLPWALPNIMTGLRIAAGLAVIGTVVGEFVAAQLTQNPGLGIVVMQAKGIGRTDLVFAAVLAASALGLAMLSAVNLAGWLALRRWHASEQN